MLNTIRSYLFRYLLNIEKKHYQSISSISPSSFQLNSSMKSLVSSEQYKEALDLFDQQPPSIRTDVTFVLALKASTKLSDYQRGIHIHQHLSPKSLKDAYIQSSLIHFYMQCHRVNDAEQIFATVEKENLFIYGAMLKGYLSNNMPEKVIELYERISMKVNEVIITILFNACGKLCNEQAIRIGNDVLNRLPKSFLQDQRLLNSTIYMLMKFGQVKDAEQFSIQVKRFGPVIYGIMMNGYKTNNQPFECLSIFDEVKKKNIQINVPMALALIGACAQIGIRSVSKKIIQDISHLQNHLQIKGALIDMWGKSSDIHEAEKIFQSISQPDLYTYTSMINAYGRNGMGYEAINIYERMPENLRNPNLYVCILNACSHSGLVDQARTIFNKIPTKTDFIVTTMVDCFSRMGIFDEAQELINEYEKSNVPGWAMYMAMLSGARTHRQIILSEKLYKQMKILFPARNNYLISASILVSNTYSALGHSQLAADERINRIKQFGNKVKCGLSWTEVNGEIVKFKAHDRSHPRSNEIYDELDRLSKELKEHGHEYDASWITRPLNDGETVESVLCGHSEKLAIAYNFIQQSRPSFIQITKNLRVCGDCHRATKMIAKIRQCEIIVRDANRNHHFSPNGQCSCQDHF